MLDIKQIENVAAKRANQAVSIDQMIEALEAPAHAAKAMAVNTTTDEEKVVLDLQTIWPIGVAIFTFVRPLLFFKPKWQAVIDRIIAGLNVIIPPK